MKRLLAALASTILKSKLASVEVILAVTSVFHGIWLVFPYWHVEDLFMDVTGFATAQATIGIVLWIVGTVHTVVTMRRIGRVRKVTGLLLFVGYLFLCGLAVMALGLSSIMWVPYLVLTILAALTHLSYAVGGSDE